MGLILGIVDASIAIWVVIVSNPDLRFVAGWIALNAIAVAVVVSALAIKSSRLASRQKRHFNSSPQTHRARTYKREQQSDFRRTYITTNGEAVKSRGEKLLADYFYQNDIRYQYERPAWATPNTTTAAIADDSKFKSWRMMISRPDFYLPDYDLYVEYWGMVDTEDESNRADYVRSMKWKMARYNENKIKFVSIYPKDLGDLDGIFRAKLRESAAGTDPDKRRREATALLKDFEGEVDGL